MAAESVLGAAVILSIDAADLFGVANRNIAYDVRKNLRGEYRSKRSRPFG